MPIPFRYPPPPPSFTFLPLSTAGSSESLYNADHARVEFFSRGAPPSFDSSNGSPPSVHMPPIVNMMNGYNGSVGVNIPAAHFHNNSNYLQPPPPTSRMTHASQPMHVYPHSHSHYYSPWATPHGSMMPVPQAILSQQPVVEYITSIQPEDVLSGTCLCVYSL